ncbi:MAG: Enolase [Candidatus Magasanikbacteria bacterium GW2011_GWC2_41_17]|uniref:Enolase n=2 Tax=Candidatus Magasanikiibacteriota TaxID=1752731 RepID=A0A0G0V8M7_9BACT|nr:MAG: Enolase [Candidatus Magasanikbacteria bacterium GW2011_GWC2_41_17]
MKIKQIQAREILDSRGNPTIRTRVVLDSGALGEASVPSGASTGSHDGVLKAVKNVNGEIAKLLMGMDCAKQAEIDKKMMEADGTDNKSRFGANAILSVSMACARAAAAAKQKPLYEYLCSVFSFSCEFFLPIPVMNVLNGGKHADSGMEVQEFMIVPLQKTMVERVRAGAEIFYTLKLLLQKQGFSTGVGDEGGFAPRLKNNEEALKCLVSAIKSAGYAPGKEIALAIDAAASEFFANGKYNFEGKKLSAEELSKIYLSWVKKYPLISIEDPFAEDDWEAWVYFNAAGVSKKTMIVGDDLFVTNVERLKKGVKLGAANAILIKLNQIGTLTETIEAIKLARKNNYKVVISHRSGETADTFIADLAVAVGADFIKTGSLSRSERVEKYNRLMEIEQEI